MRYDVVFSCGHHGSVVLHGSGDARAEGRLRWFEQNEVCPECKEKAKANGDGKAEVTNGLPALIGTPKQVAWATTLRERFFEKLSAKEKSDEVQVLQNFRGERMNRALDAYRKDASAVREYFKNQRDCRFWIDGRNGNFDEQVKTVLENVLSHS